MAIDFGNHEISRLVISTALGHSGRGLFPYYFLPSHRKIVQLARELEITIFTKSSTTFGRTGNFVDYNPFTYKYVQRIPGTKTGMLNAYGLTNPGVVACAREIRKSCELGLDVIPNFYPEFNKGTDIAIGETLQAIEIFEGTLGPFFWAVEINGSCPNSQEKISQNMIQILQCSRTIRRRFPWLIQIAKTSIVHPHDFIEELATIVDVIHSMNTIPYELVFDVETNPSPLSNVGGGGVSGSPAKHQAYAYNSRLTLECAVKNVIFGCGVESEQDCFDYWDLGARLEGYSVSICSPVIRIPNETFNTIKELESFL